MNSATQRVAPSVGATLGRVVGVVDVRLLGPLQVVDGSGVVIDVPGNRPRALLALLALQAPDAVSSDRIIDTLWGEEELRSPDSALHVAVSRLRGSIGDDVIETQPGGYRLGIPVSNSDVERFRRQKKRGLQFLTLGHPAAAGESFRQALAQWRGDALADLRKFEFAEQAARQLTEERLSVVEWLMEAELGAGNHELVVGELSGLVDAFPLREKLWAHLMVALYRSGRQAEALRTYARVRDLLGEELGIEPSPELSDLEERILLHDPVLDDRIDGNQIDWPTETELLNFSAGDVIVDEGAPADTVYWIEAGTVEVCKSTPDGRLAVVTKLGQGHYFGELASLLGTGRTATVRASSPVTVSVHSVDTFRARLGAERTKDETERAPADAVRELIRGGQYLRAYDLASSTIDLGSGDIELCWLGVLALARSGATTQARRRFDSLGLDSIDPSSVSTRLAQDIAGLGARLDKNMALSTTGEDRSGWARRSAKTSASAFQRFGAAYNAVNAATMFLVAGDKERAAEQAKHALESLHDWEQLPPEEQYWDAVTEAEAALVLGDTDRAATALAAAGEASEGNHADRASTLKQLRMVCDLLDVDPALLQPIHNPVVAHFCGHRILPDGQVGRFSVDDEARVAGELRAAFDRLGVGVGFGSLAAGADILAAEALLERGAELQVVLPFDREEFVRTSVAPAGPEWVSRFERCRAASDRVTTAIGGEYLDDPVLFDFCAQIAMGDALMRAQFLETEAHQVAVWDGVPTGGIAGTAVDIGHWQTTGRASTIIHVNPGPPGTNGAQVAPLRRIRSIVFADFAGFSTLTDAQLLVFQDVVMGGLAAAIEPFKPQLLSGRTWGDGLYLVFEEITAAADCALGLQDTIREMDFAGAGLPSLRGMRVAAHATPVFDGWDPIAGSRLFFGAGVTQTARIEPRTPEGEIYTTHPFAALAMLARDSDYECQYVGTMPTAKGYGSLPLFSLRRRTL